MCLMGYIGQTEKYLETRIYEHKTAVKIKNTTSTTASIDHICETVREFDFENVIGQQKNQKDIEHHSTAHYYLINKIFIQITSTM